MGQAARNAPLRVVGGRDVAVVPRAATTPVPVTPSAQLSQLPAQVNIAAYQGDDLSFTLTVTNPDNTPADLTGTTILSQIRPRPSDPITATLTSSVSSNVITLTLTAANATFSGVFFWDCQVTYSSGLIHTIAAGTFSMTADISHIP
jgi:hypothetical protein